MATYSNKNSPRTSTSRTPALFNRETYRYSSRLSLSGEARRYSVLVLQSTNAGLIPRLRRANPNLKIFVYQNLAYARPGDPTGQTTCTSLPTDRLNHPTWFLIGLLGNRITAGADFVMNVGDPGYEGACVAHAIGLAKRLGFNGIFFDGVSASLAYEFPPDTNPAARLYPTLVSWQSAMYSLLSYAGRMIHANGLQVIGNIGGSTVTPGLWQLWNTPLDGAEEESWVDGGQGLNQQLPSWSQKLANLAWSEAHGKYDLLHSYNETASGNTFGLASMLLAANGHSSYSTSNGNVLGYEAWYPEYTVAEHIGGATGSYGRLANGVYQRFFANGLVLVNPTTHSVGRFSVPGGPYSNGTQTGLRAVSLGPTSGVILVKDKPKPKKQHRKPSKHTKKKH